MHTLLRDSVTTCHVPPDTSKRCWIGNRVYLLACDFLFTFSLKDVYNSRQLTIVQQHLTCVSGFDVLPM